MWNLHPTRSHHHDKSEPCPEPHESKSKEQRPDARNQAPPVHERAFLTQPVCLACAAHGASEQCHTPQLTDFARHANKEMFFHWCVERRTSEIVVPKTRWRALGPVATLEINILATFSVGFTERQSSLCPANAAICMATVDETSIPVTPIPTVT